MKTVNFAVFVPCWHSFGLKEGLSTQSRWGENLKILQLEMFSEKYLKKKKKNHNPNNQNWACFQYVKTWRKIF